ncbi:MAG: PEP/pyruvate-binding domain-containing protein [Thermodesulfobacteriota bacterium]|nr:PEP/pyruvate-binding domain-containing protein [Thermodesulfobacteriota bacterium]
MTLVLPLKTIRDEDRGRVGGKAFSLARMAQSGMNVPHTLCVTTDAYRRFVKESSLGEGIVMELNRKAFKEMGWEEMWDTALRIRNMFLKTGLSEELGRILKDAVVSVFDDAAVVVRSSAPGEDSAEASFAGLHESYVNIKGPEAIVEHIKLVWASLWSDRALLYRRELGLAVEGSSMAVVIQEIVVGERSGVAFGQNPNDASQAVIEAVHGLNQGLVDGTVQPDRWILDRLSGRVISHTPASRDKALVPTAHGVAVQALGSDRSGRPPLDQEGVAAVFDLCYKAEDLFGLPQDVEWTVKKGALFGLQSRPISTAVTEEPDDKRPWYLSLHRSFENLKDLKESIEQQWLPLMSEEAERLAGLDLAGLSDDRLAEEIRQRSATYDKWVGVYWDQFIPMAHGIRLFGQVYNDTVRPSDAFEFMRLLGDTEMISLKRNRMLGHMAAMIRSDEKLAHALRAGQGSGGRAPFDGALETFVGEFGDLSCGTTECIQGRDALINFLLEMAQGPPPKEGASAEAAEGLVQDFLSHFEGQRATFARELLALGRASYRLRDDDNIYLGRIKAQWDRAVDEAKTRMARQGKIQPDRLSNEDAIEALKNPAFVPGESEPAHIPKAGFELRARQLVGQPAGPGIAKGKARVILDPSDLMHFKAGEILVCDALDPTMTFVVPLSSGIVERRGGMLIHGAIIAREYGLPCVTGVPEATQRIGTGDDISVDGYLGIVVITAAR